MTYSFIYYFALSNIALSSTNFEKSMEFPEKKEGTTCSLLSFSFNLKNFDDFKCNFNNRSIEILTTDCSEIEIHRSEHVFFDVFCMLFIYSELKNNKFFFDWTRRLYICRYNKYVKPITFIHQYKRIMPEFCKIIRLFGNNIYKTISCTFDKCQPVLVDINDDIVTITCNNEVDNTESSDLEDFDDFTFCLREHTKKAIDDFSDLFSERYSKILSKKKLKDTVHEFGDYMLEGMISDLLIKELELPLDFNFIKSLKNQLKVFKPEQKIKRSLKEYQRIKEKTINFELCCSKLKNNLISGLSDPTKVKFDEMGNLSQFIDSIANHSVEILNEWRD